jgi:hypothetical protein
MEEEYRRKEDFEQAYEDLDEEDKKELNEIGKELKKIQDKNPNPNLPIDNKELKKRIAKICSKLIEETPNDKTSIRETSYIIAGGFIGSNYGDRLDEAVEIAGELELPEHHVSGDVLQMWEKMKKIFQQYLSK